MFTSHIGRRCLPVEAACMNTFVVLAILESSICIRCIMYTYTKHHVLTNCYKMSGRVQEETFKKKSFHVQLSEFKLSNNSVERKLALFSYSASLKSLKLSLVINTIEMSFSTSSVTCLIA